MNRVLEFIIKAKDNISDVLSRVANKFMGVKDAASEMASGVEQSTRKAASATDDFTHSLRKTSVDWDAIKKREEEAKQRRIDLVRLNRELKKAEEEASKATGAAAEEARDRVKMLKAGIDQLAEKSQTDFNAMNAGLALMHGNFEGAAKGAVQLARQMGVLKMSAAAASVAFLAITAVVELFRMWAASIEETRQRIADLDARKFQKELDGIADALKRINSETARSNKLFDEETERTKGLIEAKKRQALAENELARTRALEGKDQAGAEKVNQQYDEQANQLEKKFNEQLADYSKKRQSVQLDILKDDLEKVAAEWRRANNALQEATIDYDREKWKEGDFSESELSNDKYYGAAKRKYDAAKTLEEELAKKKLELEDAVRKAAYEKDIGLAEQVAAAEAKEQEAKDEKLRVSRDTIAKNELIREEENAKELEGVWRDWYTAYGEYAKNKDSQVARERCQLLQEYYELLAQCTDDAERQQLKADYENQKAKLDFLKQFEDEEKQAREKKKAEEKQAAKEVHDQRIKNAQAELAESQKAQQEATARVQAAQSAVARAWGWYKDKDSLKQQIAGEEGDIAARQQYAKDYQHLTKGRWADEFAEALHQQRRGRTDKVEELMAQWRKGPFGLSVEDEATMRVALAQDAEKQANMDLARVAENTDALTDILAVLKGGEE